jgi:WD40 repeat protein
LWSVAISPDNKTLATASADKRVLLWDLESGKKLCELTGHLASIQFVRFSPDGKYLASAGRDNTIRIWDCKSQSLVRELVGHQDFVNSLDFSADGSQLVSVAHDSSVILWNMETGEQVKRIEILPKHELWAVAFSPRQNRILFGGTNKS